MLAIFSNFEMEMWPGELSCISNLTNYFSARHIRTLIVTLPF